MIGCVPTASDDVVSVAVLPASATVPSGVTPSKNETVPVGLVPPETVAVNVTDWPNVDGLSDETTPVVVAGPAAGGVAVVHVQPAQLGKALVGHHVDGAAGLVPGRDQPAQPRQVWRGQDGLQVIKAGAAHEL